MNRRPFPMASNTGWMTDAACAGHHPDVWHTQEPDTIRDRGHNETKWSQAKAICDRCPVQPDCLAHALAEGERWGMWGGLTPNELVAHPDFRPRSSDVSLTGGRGDHVAERRSRIVAMIAEGHPRPVIADALGVSPGVVSRDAHRMGLTTRQGAMA